MVSTRLISSLLLVSSFTLYQNAASASPDSKDSKSLKSKRSPDPQYGQYGQPQQGQYYGGQQQGYPQQGALQQMVPQQQQQQQQTGRRQYLAAPARTILDQIEDFLFGPAGQTRGGFMEMVGLARGTAIHQIFKNIRGALAKIIKGAQNAVNGLFNKVAK